nr:hypothetical protein [Tanacetum cinerariifolium]
MTLSSKVVDPSLRNNKWIQRYLQNEHHALWEVIEFSDSYQAPLKETGKGSVSESSVKKKGRTVAITTKDMQKRRNDVKARKTLLLALPDEHQLRFNKYETAQELWGAILKTFGGNEATKKTKKNQLKQQYGNFKAEGSETLEQTFNKLQDIVSHLEFMDVEIEQDDLNQNLSCTRMANSEINSQNMAFISSSNTNSGKGEVHTASVPTASSQVSTASTDVVAVSISHDTVCAYIASQLNGSQIKYEDITQIDEDDIKEMDIKWNMALLSMRADRFSKRIGKKITIQGFDVAGIDKSKVECFNCHKMGHFARECRAPRSQDRGKRESYKQGPKEEEQAPKALMAIDEIRWDWSYMANEKENHALVTDEEVPTEFALMAKSSSSSKNKVYDDSFYSKSCRKNTKNLNTKITKLNEELSDSKTNLYHYKLGLSQVEARLVEFKTQEIKFCKKIRGLKRDVEVRNNKIKNLMNELEQVKKEKEGLDNKLIGFEFASKDLDTLLESQRTDKNKEGQGYNVIPPSSPAQVYSPLKKDMSWTGLPEFADDTVTDYSRPTPSIDSSTSNTSDLQNSNFSVFKPGESSNSIMSKPMIKFVKAADSPGVIKTNKTETARKPPVKYAEMYRITLSQRRINLSQRRVFFSLEHILLIVYPLFQPSKRLQNILKMAQQNSRTRSTETSDGLAAIQAQLNNLPREIKKFNEKVYAAQVGCRLYFTILDIPEDVKVPLILGRPFLSTTYAKINVFKRKITLRVGDEKIIFKSAKPDSSLIKRVYMLGLRERLELDFESRLIGVLILNRSLDPLYGDYIKLNDLNVPLELRRDQVDDLMSIIEEGEVVDKPMIEDVKTRNYNKLIIIIIGYPNVYDKDEKIRIDYAYNLKFSCMIVMKDKIKFKRRSELGNFTNGLVFIGNFYVITDFTVMEDTNPYLDEGMGYIVVREHFYKSSCVEASRFDEIITIRDEDDSEEIATWDGGRSTWGGRVRVFGTVPVSLGAQEIAWGRGEFLAGKGVVGVLFG